jgi:hypothetical protein
MLLSSCPRYETDNIFVSDKFQITLFPIFGSRTFQQGLSAIRDEVHESTST